MSTRAFSARCEVWTKPWFRKARPKVVDVCWFADDYADFLRFLRTDMDTRYKRWTLLNWHEERVEVRCNARKISEQEA